MNYHFYLARPTLLKRKFCYAFPSDSIFVSINFYLHVKWFAIKQVI